MTIFSTGGIWRVYYIDIHYNLSVARWALPIQLLVAQHIKVAFPGVREDDLASPAVCLKRSVSMLI